MFAKQAYRTILVCYRDMTMEEYEAMKEENNQFEEEKDRDALETDLVAVGIFGLQDPLRETIVPSVKLVRRAGIQVIMCTGDNLETATAISKNAGIISDDLIDKNDDSRKYACMTGE